MEGREQVDVTAPLPATTFSTILEWLPENVLPTVFQCRPFEHIWNKSIGGACLSGKLLWPTPFQQDRILQCSVALDEAYRKHDRSATDKFTLVSIGLWRES